jgi:hypothetical protein
MWFSKFTSLNDYTLRKQFLSVGYGLFMDIVADSNTLSAHQFAKGWGMFMIPIRDKGH